jgi:hypothetical protein
MQQMWGEVCIGWVNHTTRKDIGAREKGGLQGPTQHQDLQGMVTNNENGCCVAHADYPVRTAWLIM